MLIRHGIEVFEKDLMVDYGKRLTDLNFPAPQFMAYMGKSTELIGGISLLFGFLTRLIAIPTMVAFLFITFGMGNGKILMDDQHPFLFVLLLFIFFSVGPGKFSLDYLLFDKKKF
jgi:putative oxidoreductase